MWNISVYYILVSYCFLLLLAVSDAYSGQGFMWKDVSSGLSETDMEKIEVDPNNPDIVYAISADAVYKTTEGGITWKEILSFRSTGNIIKAISVSDKNTGGIFVGTLDGLYQSSDGGTRWQKVFRGIGAAENTVLSVKVNSSNSDVIYIGTETGIFISEDMGKNWEKARNIPAETAVSAIAVDYSNTDIIYAASEKGIYRSKSSGAGWTRIFIPGLYNGDDDIIDDKTANENKTDNNKRIRSMVIHPFDPDVIYIATSDGLFISDDSGVSWTASPGRTGRDIRHLVIDPANADDIIAATDKGVFRYLKEAQRWEELYKGLISSDVRYLAASKGPADNNYVLWAATRKGIYKSDLPSKSSRGKDIETAGVTESVIQSENIFKIFAQEPTIEEIREAAIIYAEVQPGKIERWRKAAARKAWLPDLRVAYDGNEDWKSSTYFYSTSSQKYKDDDITEGEDDQWSVSLTWELGDLIWNNDQTSIDSRSRLMVQLRDDVLNEVTRLYFERRRLQIKMVMSPGEEIADKIEEELRLQELTANIDALTGSYLSKRLGNP